MKPPSSFSRRHVVLSGIAACIGLPAGARAARPTGGALRVGADTALVESGLAPSLQRAFTADTGLAVRIVASPAMPLLDSLAAGELDLALSNVPQAEAG